MNQNSNGVKGFMIKSPSNFFFLYPLYFYPEDNCPSSL